MHGHPNAASRRKVLCTPMIETLEQRKLLSASVSGGELKVVGTGKADQIFLTLANGDATKLFVKVNGAVSTFSMTQVREIKIYGLGGNDNIQMIEGNGAIARQTSMFGGGGGDEPIDG